MASTSLEASRTGGRTEEAKPSDNGKAGEAKPEAPAGGGGMKAWLPLALSVLIMPALAYATTQFVLLPKLQRAINGGQPAAAPAGSGAAAETANAPARNLDKPAGKNKVTVQLTKLLVNVAGTMGTRYLMTSLTLVGNNADFKDKIEDNKDQLMDLATGVLSSKTISDLEKPGARNIIRTELLTVFNNALGGPVVQEIYITELAIQ